MIDIEKAKTVFKEYVKSYNSENEKIKMKIFHIERTSQIAKEIAKSENLSEEDIKLAELIGLLHDIGRFEQIRIYNTFMDKDSINHGEYGVKVLFEDGLIRKFLDETKYDNIIKRAILNHNRDFRKIDKDLNEKELLHSKIIRDTDKADILYILSQEGVLDIFDKKDITNDKISDEIYKGFFNNKYLEYKYIKTSADLTVAHFVYVYDFNFPYTCNYVKENKYFDKMYEDLPFKNEDTIEKFKEIYKACLKELKNIK